MTISPETLATLQMLRRQYRPLEIPAAPTKRPVGGRPNPIAEHRYHRRKLPAAVRAARRRAERVQPPRDTAPRTAVEHFVAAYLEDRLPIDQELTGRELSDLLHGKPTHKGWEHLAVALREADAPCRLLCLKQRSRYVIEHR